MYRILFMPFLRIPSGHHHVADCLERQLKNSSDEFQCEKVEILSYSYGVVETFVSAFYLRWIEKFPDLYSRVYRWTVNKKKVDRRYYIYEILFLRQMQKLLLEKRPDAVVCTHALPSYLLNILKRKGIWTGTIINVYTDYYINDLWGASAIDYHFVPSLESKRELMEKGIHGGKIIVSGIPIDPIFKWKAKKENKRRQWKILISGGNMGAGSIVRLVSRLQPTGKVVYYVLCGKNDRLFEQIERFNHPFIRAIPYLDSKEKMNDLYDTVDGVISKPGGVTITECLWKGLPIFVYEALPGQEEFNLSYLSSQGLVTFLRDWNHTTDLEARIIQHLQKDLPKAHERFTEFSSRLETADPVKVIREICIG